MTRTKSVSLLDIAAIFLVNFAYMSDMVIIPAADAILNQFSGAPAWLLNFILTGSQLAAVPSALLAPLLMRRFRKKHLILFFFSLFTIASCAGALIPNAAYLALMRAVVGFSFGALAPTALSLLTEIYQNDTRKCAAVLGAFNGVMTAMGAIMTVIAGFLCVRRWDAVYLEYLAAVPMLLLMAISIPSYPPECAQPQNVCDGVPQVLSIRQVCFLVISIFFSCLTFNTMTYQCSIFVSQTGLGDSVFSGVISSTLAACSALSSFFFSLIFQKLRHRVCMVCFSLTALVYAGCCFPSSKLWILLCMVVLGLAYGLELPYFYLYAAEIAPASKRSLVMGIVAASLGFGAFFTSYIVTFLEQMLHVNELVALWPVYILFSLAAAAMYLPSPKRIKPNNI